MFRVGIGIFSKIGNENTGIGNFCQQTKFSPVPSPDLLVPIMPRQPQAEKYTWKKKVSLGDPPQFSFDPTAGAP